MKITKTEIPGLLIIEPKIFGDSRGCFFELFNQKSYQENDLKTNYIQDNVSYSSKNAVRGLHYQLSPFAQAKLVQVLHGKVLDVAVDLRENSPTYGQHYAIELSAENKLQFYIPRGFAHGLSVLSDHCVFYYKCDNFYNHEAERGINFNDPELGIDWKIPVDQAIVSPKDEVLPSFKEAEKNFFFKED
ncbi:dTDP-4-dehydrorhamnose 3,5-epimerase [Alkalitalea saponilacus]|uniref:dTDP-4-dehydrorhamnose 3,5-epimerase n=1 Tax=Alkalitalea saponilacus TaxID=889453 RepID=A0A1T5H9J9_9BACT|nr:dTDP-4-dehydrorhamnose 3,5-epimerase [Alkalitalea saponilacus]ASB50817.1 dTDP-4-dehydrorhamnose 3,5-epimerase [Alkalitalea saponilacus]SKC17373.1 dTDP-4-dehydrorhamnose 3,5-epimerase [Alkalitalea saponilacus]